MSTFSITSPRFTEEDNQRELASLTPQELQAIEEDVCGRETDTFNESEDMKAEGVVQLYEAIGLIPLNEKQAYTRALEVCPELVKKESDPVAFLRADNFNSWNAARRLVNFWEMRRKIFGEEAFLLPLTSTGRGALNMDAIALLDLAIWVKLPDDSKGRTVVFFDRSQLRHTSEFRVAMLQVMIYIFCSVIQGSESAQRKGIVLAVNSVTVSLIKYDRKLSKNGLKLLRECLPIKVKALHVCFSRRRPPFDYILPVVMYLMGKDMRRRLVVHHGSDSEVLSGLHSYGLKMSGIPKVLHGDWDLQVEYFQWLNDRRELERSREQSGYYG